MMYNSKVCKVSRVRRTQHNYRQLTRAILERLVNCAMLIFICIDGGRVREMLLEAFKTH